jgi:hypothetical protein
MPPLHTWFRRLDGDPFYPATFTVKSALCGGQHGEVRLLRCVDGHGAAFSLTRLTFEQQIGKRFVEVRA